MVFVYIVAIGLLARVDISSRKPMVSRMLTPAQQQGPPQWHLNVLVLDPERIRPAVTYIP